MLFGRRADSHELSSDAFVLKPVRRSSRLTAFMLGVVAVAALGSFAAWYLQQNFVELVRFEHLEADKQDIERDNRTLRETIRELDETAQGLRGELERTGLDLEIRTVTQMELERQISVLNEQLKLVREELEFMKTAGGEKR